MGLLAPLGRLAGPGLQFAPERLVDDRDGREGLRYLPLCCGAGHVGFFFFLLFLVCFFLIFLVVVVVVLEVFGDIVLSLFLVLDVCGGA